MAKFISFEEIKSWIEARAFNKKIYEITEKGIFKKDYDSVRQIRRASISISSSIAEGFERKQIKNLFIFYTSLKHHLVKYDRNCILL